MLREMEKQKQMQSSSKDTADAKLEVFKEEVETRAVQLMQKALKTSRIGSIGTEDLSKLSVTGNMNEWCLVTGCCKCKAMNQTNVIS